MPDPSTHEDLRLIEKTLTYGPHWPAATDALARLSARLVKLEAVAADAQCLYNEASSSWNDDDISLDSSYAQAGGYIRARTMFAIRESLAALDAQDVP